MPIDYKRYPPNWKTEIVPFVLKRANDCCEECGLRNGQSVYRIKLWVKINGRYKFTSIWFSSEHDAKRECRNGEVKKVTVVLTISHTDHDETNVDVKMDRLRALCQACHLRYDAREKYERQFK
jgi:hypothetical protein